ncbi:MAG: spore cortex biosynthesis protein YabQ [Clostridia bacterium]|nr:spore cortex biosynthesis protein YabQ [Clostridia bacterium]
MFVSQNQIYYFAECLFIGVISGFIYEIYYFIKLFFKRDFIKQAIDFCFFIVPTALYFKLSEIFLFPDFRAYMFLGVFLGFLLYCISFHKLLAKFSQTVYNKTISFIRRKRRDRKQKEKLNDRGYGNSGNNSFRASRNTRVSSDSDNSKGKSQSRT